MERKSVSFEQLSDIFGFRVIVETVDDCYRALGVVHTTWPMVPGRYKDYISTPKQNDYRSIHTTLIGPGTQRVELQIRTEAMEEIAEFGIAAHALYKEGVNDNSVLAKESRAYQWLRRTIDLLADGDNPEEFLEHTKLELFHDQVFCFTPKGRLIALPRGATPIDFAYAVHTDVGNTAVGCKINGRMAPLLTELQNGDEVEIVRADGQTPPAAWESLVVTGKARASIRRATRAAVRRQYTGLGRPDTGARLRTSREDRSRTRSSRRPCPASPGSRRRTCWRLSAAARCSRATSCVRFIPITRTIAGRRARTDRGERTGQERAPKKTQNGPDGTAHPASRSAASTPIVPVRFAPEGGAVPGDRIVGILTPGEGVTIYPIQSASLAAFDNEPDRWIDVRWDVDSSEARQRFPARIALQSINEPGTPRADRPGDRGPRRQYRQRLDEAPHPGLHGGDDRLGRMGPQAPQRHHRGAARQAGREPRGPGDGIRPLQADPSGVPAFPAASDTRRCGVRQPLGDAPHAGPRPLQLRTAGDQPLRRKDPREKVPP